jgi:dolichyl-phosphate-mannose-protein mannosyltransferase
MGARVTSTVVPERDDARPADGVVPDEGAGVDEPPDVDAPTVSRDRMRDLATRRFGWLLLAVVVVGAVLRLGIGLTDDQASTDETAYLRSGISLVNGDGYQRDGHPETHFPPLVPALLGLGSKVFDDPHTATVWLTAIASIAMLVPLGLLARRLAGPLAGVIAAGLAALAPGISTTLVNRGSGTEVVYGALVVGALWFVVDAAGHEGRGRLARIGLGGTLVGLAYLTRPEGLFAAVPLGLGVLWLATSTTSGRRARLRQAVVAGAVFALPLVMCVAPYATYLHANTGSWQLTAKTQDASIEAWQAVARGDREARDRVLWALDETGYQFSVEHRSLTSLARDDPSGFAEIVWTNLGALWRMALLGGQLLPVVVWPVAAFGAWRLRASRQARLLLVVAAIPVATGLAFFIQARYLVVLVALTAVLAGVGVAGLRGRWRVATLGVLLALGLLTSVQGFHGTGAGWWHPSEGVDQRAAADWIAAHSDPGDRIVTRSQVVQYYADRTALALPYGELSEVIDFSRHHGARYLVLDHYTVRSLRPQLWMLRFATRVDGLRLVYETTLEGRTVRIFELDPPAPEPPAGEHVPTLGFTGDA